PAARTLVVGCDEDYDALRRGAALAESREVAVIGFVDVARPPAAQAIGHVEELARLLEEHHIDTVLVCGYVTDQAFREIANTATATGCRLLSVPRSFDLGGLQPRMLSWHGQALVELTAPTLKVGHIILKRCLDLIGSGLGLVVVARRSAADRSGRAGGIRPRWGILPVAQTRHHGRLASQRAQPGGLPGPRRHRTGLRAELVPRARSADHCENPARRRRGSGGALAAR